MAGLRLLVLEGDGIGPEVIDQAIRVLTTLAANTDFAFEVASAAFGGASIDECGSPVTEDVLRKAKSRQAVLLGAVGGPRWDAVPPDRRPERGLLRLRSALGVYANVRPVKLFKELKAASPLRAKRVGGTDFVVVRELIGGVYYGEPRGIEAGTAGRRAVNTTSYTEFEIKRVGRLAFKLAQSRRGVLTSVDKANVLEVSRLWREVMTSLSREFPKVKLNHLYVDNCAMQFVLRPTQFDVVVTGNLFGDILSDIGGALTGSLGMLPSAALGEGTALYEPVHGSAPDIAGQGKANPLGAILTVAMMLGITAKRPKLARAVEAAVEATLSDGYRTADLQHGSAANGSKIVSTEQMGEAVSAHLERLLKS